ncbi:MAG: hypothetical protein ACE5OR_06350 [bacterium]
MVRKWTIILSLFSIALCFGLEPLTGEMAVPKPAGVSQDVKFMKIQKVSPGHHNPRSGLELTEPFGLIDTLRWYVEPGPTTYERIG